MMRLEKMTFENLRIQNLKMDSKMAAFALVLLCDVIFAGIMFVTTYGEYQLQAKEMNAASITDDTLGSCSVSCLLGGKIFDTRGVKCFPDITFAHCKRLESEDVSLYCSKSVAQSKLVTKFSTRPCY